MQSNNYPNQYQGQQQYHKEEPKSYGEKIFIGYRGFSAQSLLTVTSFIEYSSFATDLIFFKMCLGKKQQNGGFAYSTNNKNECIKMSLNAISIRALAYAMKEIVKVKSNELGYEEITKSDCMKKITLGYAMRDNSGKKEDVFYINTINIDSGLKVNVSMNKWEMVSFADSLMILAEETEKMLYKFERSMKKQQTA